MTTEVKILANRLNARKSTGPKTPEGKAVVAQNALKHGLSATRDVITTESQEEFDIHRSSLLNELNPQTPMESMLADRIVSLSWRLKRADLIQNQTIDVLTQKDATNPLAKLAKSLGLKGLGLPQPDPSDSNPDLILGRVALKDFSNERVLDRLLMYERRIEHSLFKTTLELQRLRLLRNLNSSDQISNSNLPEPAAPHLAPGFTGGPPSTEPNNAPEPPQDDIPHTTSDIRIAQNKPNFQNPRTAAIPAPAAVYEHTPPLPPDEKQTQSNPTCRGEAPREAGFPRNPQSAACTTHHAIRSTPPTWGKNEPNYTPQHTPSGATNLNSEI